MIQKVRFSLPRNTGRGAQQNKGCQNTSGNANCTNLCGLNCTILGSLRANALFQVAVVTKEFLSGVKTEGLVSMMRQHLISEWGAEGAEEKVSNNLSPYI